MLLKKEKNKAIKLIVVINLLLCLLCLFKKNKHPVVFVVFFEDAKVDKKKQKRNIKLKPKGFERRSFEKRLFESKKILDLFFFFEAKRGLIF